MNLDELRASGAHALVAELLERFCHDMLGPLSASDSNLSFLLFSDVSESDRVEAERDAKSGLAIMGAQVKALRVISAALAEPIAPRLTNAEPLTPLLEKRSRDWLQCSIELSIPRDLPVRGAGLLSDAVDFLVHGAYRYNFFELPVRAAAYVRENQIILEVRDGGSSAGRTELMELSSPQGQLAAHRDSTRGRYYVGLFLVSVWCVAQILDARLESEYLDNETVFRIIVPCSEEGTGLEHLQPSSA